MNYFRWTFLFVLGINQGVFGQTNDEANLAISKIDKSFWELKKSDLPDYTDATTWGEESITERGKGSGARQKDSKKSRKLFSGGSSSVAIPSFVTNIIKWLLIGISVFALTFLLFRLFQNRSKSNKDVPSSLSIEKIEDDLLNASDQQMNDLVEEYVAAGDFRTAIRILYLQRLKTFGLKQWIVWRKDKTNKAYLRELSGREVLADFKKFTKIFEESWYGGLEISSESFNALLREQELIQVELNQKT